MSSFETNKHIWSHIYKAGKNNLNYPSENLVRYLYFLYNGKPENGIKVLDYGFGSGNNLIHLLRLGMDVSGVEVSKDAKKITLENVK